MLTTPNSLSAHSTALETLGDNFPRIRDDLLKDMSGATRTCLEPRPPRRYVSPTCRHESRLFLPERLLWSTLLLLDKSAHTLLHTHEAEAVPQHDVWASHRELHALQLPVVLIEVVLLDGLFDILNFRSWPGK